MDWWDHILHITRGCTPVSEGCKNCWASAISSRFSHIHGEFSNPRIDTKEIRKALSFRKPRVITVSFMSDFFHESFSDEEILTALGTLAAVPEQHTLVVLTKRAGRMLDILARVRWSATNCHVHFENATTTVKRIPWFVSKTNRSICTPPPNIVFGVSVENHNEACNRLPLLAEAQRRSPWYRWLVSVEPYLGRISWNPTWYESWRTFPTGVIVGCESSSGRREPPCLNAVIDIRDICKDTDSAFCFKQWPIFGRDHIDKLPQLEGRTHTDFVWSEQ